MLFTTVFGIGEGNFKITVLFFNFINDSLKHNILIVTLRRTFV